MNFATLPCLREVAMSHPEGNFSSLMCLEERCELLQLACPFLCQEPRREGIGICKGQAFFLPNRDGANFLLLLATAQPCFLGKGWSLCL